MPPLILLRVALRGCLHSQLHPQRVRPLDGIARQLSVRLGLVVTLRYPDPQTHEDNRHPRHGNGRDSLPVPQFPLQCHALLHGVLREYRLPIKHFHLPVVECSTRYVERPTVDSKQLNPSHEGANVLHPLNPNPLKVPVSCVRNKYFRITYAIYLGIL